MASNTSPKKPSPLSYGSPRSSPFKRPESPYSRSPSNSTVRATTPTASPSKTPSATYQQPPQQPASPASSVTSAIFSPQSTATVDAGSTPTKKHNNTYSGTKDAISQLNPTQLREIRESFQVLDRDNDGHVTREDVLEVHTQLGLDSAPQSLAPYFPPSSASKLNLPTYLNNLSNLLSPLSRPDELTAAFAAFDVDDSGQIDADELRDALLNTPPEKGEEPLTAREIDSVLDSFTGRRAFGKGTVTKGRGEVFRYLEFVGSISGGKEAEAQAAVPAQL